MWPFIISISRTATWALIDPDGQEVALRGARAMIARMRLADGSTSTNIIEVRGGDGKLVHQVPFRDAVVIGG